MATTDLNQKVKLVLVLLDTCTIPEKGPVELKIDRSFDIKVTAEELAARMPPYRSRQTTPSEYLAKNVPPAPKLLLTESE